MRQLLAKRIKYCEKCEYWTTEFVCPQCFKNLKRAKKAWLLVKDK